MLDKWRKLGINEAIHASKFELPMNPNLLTALIPFWSLVTNTFSFPKAYMTPAVADIFALTCLPLVGVSVHSQMAYGKGLEEDILIGVNLNYVPFIKSMKGASSSRVTYPEKCCFYLLWICRFLACTSSKCVIQNYLPIARALTNGV